MDHIIPCEDFHLYQFYHICCFYPHSYDDIHVELCTHIDVIKIHHFHSYGTMSSMW